MVKPTPDDREWLRNWQAASPRLESLRRESLARVDVAKVIEVLTDAFEAALRHGPPRRTSGLVEQQALFMKGRK